MQLNSTKILGISITTSTNEIILEYIKKYLIQSVKKTVKSLVIVTPNPEQIVLAQTNTQFAKILNRADVAIPDGIGVSIAAHVSRIPGVEFMEDLVTVAAKRGDTIGLIGGRDGLAVRALECLKAKYPGLQGWAVEPESHNLQEIIQKIQKTDTRMIFVGLGAPKQEFFIEELIREMSFPRRRESSVLYTGSIPAKAGIRLASLSLRRSGSGMTRGIIFMSVGGSFDIISGRLKRAPVLIRSIGFEWLWRLFQEPWRWKRQVALLKFVWLVAREKLASQGDALRS